MEIIEIINELVDLGYLTEYKVKIDSLYCYGIIPGVNWDSKDSAPLCIFLLLITTDADDLCSNLIVEQIKSRLEHIASIYLIVHDLETVNEALNKDSEFLIQVINHGLKVWNFRK